MTSSKSELQELQELQVLQRKSEELREQREADEADVHQADTSPTLDTEPAEAEEDFGESLASQVEGIMSELETAAAEHPALALLAAFGIGIFVGQLLSRR